MFAILKLIFSLRLLLTIAVLYFLFGGPLKNLVFDLVGIEQTPEQRQTMDFGFDFLKEDSEFMKQIDIMWIQLKEKLIALFNGITNQNTVVNPVPVSDQSTSGGTTTEW